ncbi:hypothetical protein WME90_17410 [Sorangium sp. So ce375]|uniref:hypothetical protein n=1 Tax=Sorangium sp. So ce375 TaxID=3133306 RepID=UPI003F5C3B5C
MRIERLFNVLILSGAAIGLGACGDDGGENAGNGGASATAGATSGGAPGSGGAGDGATAGSGGGGESATEGSGGAGGGAAAGSGGGESATAGSGGGDGAGGASSLDCSAVPDPYDACGCTCCWMTGCLNTEPCCATFCRLGNDGEGCCGG